MIQLISNQRSRAVLGAEFPVVDWRGVGSNPAGNIYFYFEFFAPSQFRTGQRAHVNEIKHNNSPVVIVVLDSRYD